MMMLFTNQDVIRNSVVDIIVNCKCSFSLSFIYFHKGLGVPTCQFALGALNVLNQIIVLIRVSHVWVLSLRDMLLALVTCCALKLGFYLP